MAKLFLATSITLISLVLVGVLYGGYLSRLSSAVTQPAAVPTSAGLAASSFRPQSLPELDPKSGALRTYASKIGLYFGSMEDSQPGNGWETDWVRNTLSSQFNLLEPGNQLKWWITEPTQGTFDFRPADALIEFAITHKMKVRGHNLLWGMSNPHWLGNEGARTYTRFSGQQLQEILVNHIRTVMAHYRDKFPGVVRWWDVTNELMGWDNKFNSDGILWTKIGSNRDRADYLRVAFETARATDPAAILCMNDWGNEGSLPDRTDNMIAVVKAFRAEGIPIDCVGMEAHLDSKALRLTKNQALQVMKSYAEMGVQVQITEFDVQVPRPEENDWDKVSTIARTLLQGCVESPNCTAFNNWGFSQAFYFNDASNQNTVTMLPWDRKNHMSPEYTTMLGVLKAAAP